MTPKQPAVQIKLSASPQEITEIDKAIEAGRGRSRADICYKALIRYLHDMERTAA